MALSKGLNYTCLTQAEVDGLKAINPAWFLTGSQSRNMATVAAGVTAEFVPQRAKVTDALNVAGLSPAPKALLTFDEPDKSTKANLTPFEAIKAWTPMATTKIGATYLPIGSPATSDPGLIWNEQFVECARALDIVDGDPDNKDVTEEFKVGFIACKIVGAPDAPAFLAKLDALHADFPLDKIWVIEAAVVDPATNLSANSTLYTRAQVEQFIKDVWAGVKTRTWVERFAWKTTSNTDKNAWFSSLCNSNGSRSSTGVVYANLV